MTTTNDLTAAGPSDLFATPSPHATPEQFADRVLAAMLGATEMLAVYLGDRLGWYTALRTHGPSTPAELAHRTGTVERYAREWLEHQAAAGYLVVAEGRPAAPESRYALPDGAAEVLTDTDSLLYLAPLARFVAAVGRALDPLIAAYRDGGGVGWADLGADAREAQADLNRPFFLRGLTQEVVPGLPELHRLLGSGARVADVGSGEGWSSIGLAAGYPGVTVDGFDIDAASVRAARRHAAGAGVQDRVRFWEADAGRDVGAEAGRDVDGEAASDVGGDVDGEAGSDVGGDVGGESTYDVVTAFECVHDLPDPVAVLASMRRLARPDGYVLVMDERSAEEPVAPADPVERLLYAYSILVCLPDGLSIPGSVGTGTVMRPAVLARHAAAAGFSRVEVLTVEHEMFRFYRLHP